MCRFLTFVHTSSTRECFAYLILSFALSWIVWIPVLFVSGRYEQVGDLLIIGTFGDWRRFEGYGGEGGIRTHGRG